MLKPLATFLTESWNSKLPRLISRALCAWIFICNWKLRFLTHPIVKPPTWFLLHKTPWFSFHGPVIEFWISFFPYKYARSCFHGLSTQWSNLFTPFNLILFVFFYHPRCIFQMHLLVSKLVFIIIFGFESWNIDATTCFLNTNGETCSENE